MRGLKYMPRKRIDNRPVKRSRSTRSLRRFTIVFMLGCALVLGMIFSGWVRWKQREIVYRFNQLQSRKESLLETRKRLIMELSSLQSPERVSEIAKTRLRMVEASRDQIVFVEISEQVLPIAGETDLRAEAAAPGDEIQ